MKLRKGLNILIYIADGIKAISDGAQVVFDRWPSRNPWNNNSGVSVREQQIESDKSRNNSHKQMAETQKIPDGAG